jgi:hydrogenase maturation protease
VAISNGNGSRVLVIGVGNENRGDDAIGVNTSRWLREKLPNDVVIAEETGDGARLMELWKGFDVVVVIDAVRSGAEPGTIHKFEAHKSPLPTGLFREEYSTHTFGIPHAIELARAMNRLPRVLLVCGIEGERFDEGAPISPAIERAAQQLAELLTFEILR